MLEAPVDDVSRPHASVSSQAVDNSLLQQMYFHIVPFISTVQFISFKVVEYISVLEMHGAQKTSTASAGSHAVVLTRSW